MKYLQIKLLFFTALIILAFCLSSITACQKTDASDSGAVHDKDTFTFTDSLGREVCVPKNNAKIRTAALIGSFADVWLCSGGTLCASADDAWDDFDLELPDAVNIGKTKEPNVELLFSANPELVLASASTAADVELCSTLENAGMTVVYFDVDTFDDYISMLDICTDITGRKDLYEQNGLKIKEQIEAIKSDYASIDLDEEQRSVLFLRASSGYIRAKNSEGSILGEMLRDLDCINIADNDDSLLENLSIESIIRQNPYHIFIVQVGDDTESVQKNIINMMEENPAWQSLDAVVNGRLHYMDKRLFNLKPNARWAEAYEILCDILRQS